MLLSSLVQDSQMYNPSLVERRYRDMAHSSPPAGCSKFIYRIYITALTSKTKPIFADLKINCCAGN